MSKSGGQLLERERELDALDGGLERVRGGNGSLVLVEGPAGIGKTSLLRAATAMAAAASFLVMTATGGALEADLPWNLVRQLFDLVVGAGEAERATLLGGAGALAAPALGLGGGAEGGAMHGLYWLTATLAARSPLLLSIDDAHWGDDPSLRFLSYLSRRIEDLPVLLVVSSRSGEAQPEALAALAATPGAQLQAPRELTRDASARLTRRRLDGSASEPLCDACHRATGGSPFLLEELLEELRRKGAGPGAAAVDAVAGATPETVRRSVLQQLSGLPSASREIAEAAALLGAEASVAEAASVAGVPLEDAASASDALSAANVFADGPSLAFRHPLVREVIYGRIPTHERGRRHREAAHLLADAGAEPQRVHAQLLLSEPAGDPWVVAQLRASAANAIGAGAPETAADLLARALNEPPAPDQRADLLAELGRAELTVGRPEAIEHLRGSIELVADPRLRARIALDLGRGLYVAGQPIEAAERLRAGYERLQASGIEEPSLAGELRASWLAVARTELRLRPEAAEFAKHVAADPPTGDSYGERALLAQVAGELTFAAEPRGRALELARSALADGWLIEQESAEGINWIAAMGALGWCDDFDAYDELQAFAQADARRRGSIIGLVNGSYGFSFSDYYRGRLPSAIAAASQAIAAASEGWIFFLPAARAQLSWSLIERGELDAAEAQIDKAENDPTWAESSMQAFVLEARARLHLARDQPEPALAAALEAGRIFERAQIANPSVLPWRDRAALAAARLGERDRATALIDEGLALARRFGAPRPIGIALMTAGAIDANNGLEAFEEAVEQLAGSPASLEHARALALFGAALRRRGRLKDARGPLAVALDMAVDFGAVGIAQRARTELAAAGARPRRSRSSGVASLTPAELRTAQLAAEGLTNRAIAEALFVSLRTVETHLTHTYRKLTISSRGELSRALSGAPDTN